MKLHRLLRYLVASMAVVALMLCYGAAAYASDAIDTGRETSLTVYFGEGGNGFSDVTFRAYRVASVSEDAQFTLTDSFSEYPVTVNGLDSSGWRALAQTLDAYVARDGLQPTQVASTGNDGNAAFSDLATGLYLVVGSAYSQGNTTYIPEPFLVSLPTRDNASGAWDYRVTASCKYESRNTPPGEEHKTVNREVLKVWQDDGNEAKRPDEIVVQLLRDDEVYDTVTLNKKNNWRHVWKDLDDSYTWRVVERQTPVGYTVTVGREGTTFVMTNTYHTPPSTPPETPPSTSSDKPGLPQTGMLWWPVPLLACAGLFLFVVGWARRRHANHKS